MRTLLHLLLGTVLTIGVSASAHATAFSLQFAGPGADCATDGVAQNTDCNDGDITDADGNLHFAIAGDELIVTAFNSVSEPGEGGLLEGEIGVAIQDYPELGGLAVNGPFPGGSDQVDPEQALFFELGSMMDFAPIVTFTDNHAPIDPDAMIGVAAFVDGVFSGEAGLLSAGELAGGALLGATGVNGWLFVNVGDSPTWYVASMSAIPEPGTAMLLGIGLTGLAARRRKTLV